MSKELDYINKMAPIITEAVKRNGKGFVSAMIAHTALESAWGLSLLSSKYNNYAGMKCGSSWTGKSVNMKTQEEYTLNVHTTIRDNFRVYDSVEEGIQGIFDFLKYPRYNKVWTAETPEDFIRYLKACGYCTSSTWVNSIINIINKYDLKKYDINNSYEKVEKKVEEKVEGVKITTTANLYLRSENSTSSNIITMIPKGSEVFIDTKQFVPVMYGDKKGFVSANYLNLKGAKYVR